MATPELIYDGPDGQVYEITQAIAGLALPGDYLKILPDGAARVQRNLDPQQRDAILSGNAHRSSHLTLVRGEQ